ncbi:MAG TPA: DUF1460 domain-containing protein [Bacteroidetes bacterium]|nr:DUF1460 domain-containing protein [Bacteroidota bacterium]
MSRRLVFASILSLTLFALQGCAIFRPPPPLTPAQIENAKKVGLTPKQLRKLIKKRLYKFNPEEVDRYLAYLQLTEPDLRLRIQHLARKMVGQPYRIFLLGEFPFEIYDPDPLFSLDHSDCVVFSEHMYAMALAHDWSSFFTLLQRIRYKDGEISMLTRNHYTEADWDVNNNWLVEDVTERLGGVHTRRDTVVIDRARFFKRWDIGQWIKPDTIVLTWIPYQYVPQVLDSLQPGDFVNVVRGYEDGRWVGHVGLITVSDRGVRNFLHSTPPKVREQPILEYITHWARLNEERKAYNAKVERENARRRAENERRRAKAARSGKKPKLKPLLRKKPLLWGFKFLRLRQDPLANLRALDGEQFPRVVAPRWPWKHSQADSLATPTKEVKP